MEQFPKCICHIIESTINLISNFIFYIYPDIWFANMRVIYGSTCIYCGRVWIVYAFWICVTRQSPQIISGINNMLFHIRTRWVFLYVLRASCERVWVLGWSNFTGYLRNEMHCICLRLNGMWTHNLMWILFSLYIIHSYISVSGANALKHLKCCECHSCYATDLSTDFCKECILRRPNIYFYILKGRIDIIIIILFDHFRKSYAQKASAEPSKWKSIRQYCVRWCCIGLKHVSAHKRMRSMSIFWSGTHHIWPRAWWRCVKEAL